MDKLRSNLLASNFSLREKDASKEKPFGLSFENSLEMLP